jgi:integrase
MTESSGTEGREKRPYGVGRVFYRPDRSAWFISYYLNGKQIREKVKGDEDAARRLLKKRNKEKEKDSFVGPSERRLTVSELLDARAVDLANRGRKSKSPFSHMALVRKHFGLDRAVDIGAERLNHFIAEEQKLGKKPATINRALQELRAAYRLAVKQRRLGMSCVPYFSMQNERNNVRKGYFEAHEFESVAAHLPPAIADLCRFAYLTGWRKGEIAGLTWDQIDHVTHEVRLDDSKNGEGRTLALSDDVWALIERRWAARSWTHRKTKQTHLSPLVFHRNGRPVRDFRKRWEKALEKAGLPTGTGARKLFHDFRRTAVRDMVRAGVHQSVAMSISGHKTVSMFLRYKITSGEEQREAPARTAALRQQRASETDTTRKVTVLPRA